MGNQYRDGNDESFLSVLKAQEESQKELAASQPEPDYETDAFKQVTHVREVLRQLDFEYSQKLTPKFGHLTKAKAQFPPFWDDEKNQPQQLPLYQHNVSSGRYSHAIQQLSLTYNSFFPNESYAKTLLEVKLLTDPFGNSPKGEQSDETNPQAIATPKQAPKDKTQAHLQDSAALISQGFDNLIKQSSWAKKEHLKMVSDMMNYGTGIYFFSNPKSYQYKALDYRKCRFPSGTSTDPDEWEYVFVKHDISFFELIKRATKPSDGWNSVGVQGLLLGYINNAITKSDDTTQNRPENAAVTRIDNLREGLSKCNYAKVCPARVEVTSCFWRNSNDKISTCMIADNVLNQIIDAFLYEKDNIYENFSDAFSIFPSDESEDEVRMVRGWGERIHPLCHAYDRSFSKFLDHIEYAATLFLSMDPNDINKKVLHFGSLNIGKFDGVQNFPNALTAIVNALVFLDSKIDAITFTSGLNKTELQGEGRGAELATILLTMEGRVHKHLMARFIERYSIHYRKVLKKVLYIALNGGSGYTIYPEVKAKFLDFLTNREVSKSILQLDDTSSLNSGLPSTWLVTARRPDASGITSSTPQIIQTLQPYLSSLPESGFKYLLTRIIADAFGDEDMIQKILPDVELTKMNSEADLQIAEMQAAILTSHHSDFDNDATLSADINPEVSDAAKFITFPSSKENDHLIFGQVLLSRADAAVESYNKREIGRPTLHIWLYNLLSTAQGHVNDLRQDAIRGSRSEARQMFQRFGNAFNMLRQVESQANAERSKRLNDLQLKLAQEKQDDPKTMEATAKLITARATQAKIQLEFTSNQFNQALEVEKNRRAEEAHILDSHLKAVSLAASTKGPATQSQSLVGRPGKNEQRGN